MKINDRYQTNRCEGCNVSTTASGRYCRTCKSQRFHARKALASGQYFIDTAGGYWWVFTKLGDVAVSGKDTKEQAFHCFAHGDPEGDVEAKEV
jgi:hypothetical protein